MANKKSGIFMLGKNLFLMVFFIFFCKVFCYSQNIRGQWEKNLNGLKIVLIFYEDQMEVGAIYPNGERYFPGIGIEYFASNNQLIIFDYGTGIYAEPPKYEYYISGNTLALIALNISARVSLMEGKYTRVR
jgi:hypothetical protein